MLVFAATAGQTAAVAEQLLKSQAT